MNTEGSDILVTGPTCNPLIESARVHLTHHIWARKSQNQKAWVVIPMLPECGFVTSYKQLNGSQACAGLIMFSFTVKLVLNFAHGVRKTQGCKPGFLPSDLCIRLQLKPQCHLGYHHLLLVEGLYIFTLFCPGKNKERW